MKYIVTKQETGCEELFMFPRTINHDTFAESVSFMKNGTWSYWERIKRKPIAAGFINGKMECYGCSTSLNLTSRLKTDTELLIAQSYFL